MGGIATFDREAILAEIDKVKAAPEHGAVYGEAAVPALWLVGDQGIYLMGSHANRDPKAEKPIYAKEADPTSGRDDWYEAKRRIFGGDDGVEALPLEAIEDLVRSSKFSTIKLRISARGISIIA